MTKRPTDGEKIHFYELFRISRQAKQNKKTALSLKMIEMAKRLKLGWIFQNESISWKPGISWVFVSLPIDGSSYKSLEIKFLRSIDIFDRSKRLRENLKLVFTKRKWKKEDLVCDILSLSLSLSLSNIQDSYAHTLTHLTQLLSLFHSKSLYLALLRNTHTHSPTRATLRHSLTRIFPPLRS